MECHYRDLHLPTGGDFNGTRRDDLWDGDAAEVFLPPDASHPLNYKEIGIAANGLWTDFDISPGHHDDLRSGFKRSMRVDPKTPVWVAELAIPIKFFDAPFRSEDKKGRLNQGGLSTFWAQQDSSPRALTSGLTAAEEEVAVIKKN